MTLAPAVLMIRPAAFSFSYEAATSNVFQQDVRVDPEALRAQARSEFDGAVAVLRAAGIRVIVVEDTFSPAKPDAVFPNNWFSTMPDGTLVLYPMAVPSRRVERRLDVLAALPGVRRVVDLSPLEGEGAFLEGTGSLVLDHDRRLAFACLSPRTTRRGLDVFAAELGYTAVVFEASLDGAAIYHTNVMMALGPDFALVGEETVTAGLVDLRAALAPRRIVPLTAHHLRAYAGNALVLRTATGPVLVMSGTGFDSLGPEVRARLGVVVALDIPTLETIGGGSARCMLAEVFGG